MRRFLGNFLLCPAQPQQLALPPILLAVLRADITLQNSHRYQGNHRSRMGSRPNTNYMDSTQILEFLRTNIEPLPADEIYGVRYRASVVLKDGTSLPCVVFQAAEPYLNLANRRFDDTRGTKEYRSILSTFVTARNSISEFDIRAVAKSPYAIPSARLLEVGGETSMSWTQFSATMKDGATFDFGTSFNDEFFDMPDGYTADDIITIVPATRAAPRPKKIFRERPFFTCFLQNREYL